MVGASTVAGSIVSDTASEPISVKASAGPIAAQEAFKAVVVAGCAWAMSSLIKSELALAAALPAAAIVATMAWSAWQRVSNWRVMRFFANLLPDNVAVVGKK